MKLCQAVLSVCESGSCLYFLSFKHSDIINCTEAVSDTWQSIVAGHIALVTANPTGDEICAVSGCVLQIRRLITPKEMNSGNNNKKKS